MQEKKLKAIVRYAYRNVPFYHKLFDANNVKPTEINTVDDLKKLPIVTKKDVRENLCDMVSRKINAERCVKSRTSGSTGFPLTIFTDKDAQNFKAAVSLRQFFECGGRLRDKQVQLRGAGSSSLSVYEGKPFYEYLGFLSTEWIIMSEIPDFLIPFLKAYKPDVMIGYPSFFQLLAEKIAGEISPRLIFCTAEILSSHCRALINSAFGAKIIDSYGCTEAGDIAWECPQANTGYHINCDSVLVEFVKDEESVNDGEEGEIVLTNLFNHAMPLIRYKIGDVGVPSDEKCSCGRTLPLMRLLKGRSDDFIILPNGKKLSLQGALSVRAKSVIEVSEYRIIQEKRNLIEVWLKMCEGYRDSSVTRFVAALREIIGENVEIRVRIVDEIPRDNSGKLRRIISRVCN
jgi:phenylacetate-CoA ligase